MTSNEKVVDINIPSLGNGHPLKLFLKKDEYSLLNKDTGVRHVYNLGIYLINTRGETKG